MDLTSTMRDALENLADGEGVWYHDCGWGAQTAEALLARGLVTGDGMGCSTPGHEHAGYLRITDAGRAAIAPDPLAVLRRLAFGRPVSGKQARARAREFLRTIGEVK